MLSFKKGQSTMSNNQKETLHAFMHSHLRAVIYARVSSDNRKRTERALETQVENCT